MFCNILLALNFARKKVSTHEKKHQHKRKVSQLNEISDDFIIANIANAEAKGNETLDPQTRCLIKTFGSSTVGENSVSQDQVIEKKSKS